MYIPVMGQVRGWWTYGGERGNSFIKRFLHKGGSNYERSTIERYAAVEAYNIQEAYDFDLTNIHDFDRLKSNRRKLTIQKSLNSPQAVDVCNDANGPRLQYDDQKTFVNLLPPVDESFFRTLKEFEIEDLFCCLKRKCDKYRDDEENFQKMVSDSSYFRVQLAYEKCEAFAGKKGFVWFCKMLLVFVRNEEISSLSTTQKAFVRGMFQDGEEENRAQLDEHEKWLDLWETRKYVPIQKADVTCFCHEFINYKIKYSDIGMSAVIKGVLFKARGIEFAEKEAPIERKNKQDSDTPTNSENHLDRYYDSRRLYSSWCKLSRGNFATLNYFWKLNLPSDPFINDSDLTFASVVVRVKAKFTVDPKRFEHLSFVDCAETKQNNMDGDLFIVHSGEILSSNILSIPCFIPQVPRSALAKPKDFMPQNAKVLTYHTKKRSQNSSSTVDKALFKHYANPDKQRPSHIILIVLEPHRCDI
jgi:hypothetical protein